MAVDIVARGLAISLVGSDGKIASDKMPTLGAISDTSGFYPLGNLKDPSAIEGKTAEEILLMMLFGIMTPTLTPPKGSVSLSEASQEVFIEGRAALVSGSLILDRGAINPAYGTSGYRAGVATEYKVNDLVFESGDFSFEIIPVLGENVINWSLSYAEGEQPYNSVGEIYDSPLSAGTLTGTFSIQAVSALLDIDGNEKVFNWFEEEDGSGYETVVASEVDGEKQNFMVSNSMAVIGVKAYDSLSQSWSWLGGSAQDSLTYFDTKEVEIDGVNYVLYTSNTIASYGERELRVYVNY